MTQLQIFNAVAERGYMDTTRWTRDQLIARQIIKLIEEIGELADHVSAESQSEVNACLSLMQETGLAARKAFDYSRFEHPMVDLAKLRHELADVQIVIFCLAALLDVDVVGDAWTKAVNDISRGVG